MEVESTNAFVISTKFAFTSYHFYEFTFLFLFMFNGIIVTSFIMGLTIIFNPFSSYISTAQFTVGSEAIYAVGVVIKIIQWFFRVAFFTKFLHNIINRYCADENVKIVTIN